VNPDLFDQLQEERLWPTLEDTPICGIERDLWYAEANSYNDEGRDYEMERDYADWEAENYAPDAMIDAEYESRFESDYD
jgi:hypothetical protein